ncbi:MAG: PspA/IM30 family protein [Gammaproteobacteria bacterium]
MKTLKRMFVTLKSQIDSVADEFENHEALAGAAIKDLEAIGSKTRIHLHRVKGMSARLEQQLAELEKEALLWSERAVKVRESDEQKALQCVKRLRAVILQIEQLQRQLDEARGLEAKVRRDLGRIQDELQTARRQKEMLSARENRTRVKAVMESDALSPRDEARDIFERWESAVVGAEFKYPETPDFEDDLAGDFEKEEEAAELRKMLDELTQGRNAPTTNDKPENGNV